MTRPISPPPNGTRQPPVTPQPGPFTFLVSDATTDQGQRLCVVEIHTRSGMTRVFMTPEDAEKMAEHWLAKARQMRTGLIIPGEVVIPAIE